MNASKLLIAGVFLCLLGGLGRGDDKPDYAKLLVGKWEVTKSDPRTVPQGAVIEFKKDGKVTVTAKIEDKEMSFEGTYKLEGNTFTLVMKVGEMEHSNTITIVKISAKEMSTKDKDDKIVELSRKK